MSRNEQVIRVLRILYKMLSSKMGIGIRQMAEEFGVHARTIRRDLEAIEQSHFPVVEVTNDDGEKRFRVGRDLFK